MHDLGALEEFLASARVDPAVSVLRPDYRGLLVTVDGLVPGPSDDAGDALLQEAEAAARKALALEAAADDLVARLTRLGPAVRAARRLIAATGPLL